MTRTGTQRLDVLILLIVKLLNKYSATIQAGLNPLQSAALTAIQAAANFFATSRNIDVD